MRFTLKSDYHPTGDQPQAIEKLTEGVTAGKTDQVLLGVTGSGKTFTIANVIEQVQKPTLIIAHNKTLAAQLYQEFREFFPDNAVSCFVSYYAYYQPEAYIPRTDTYIEKETEINEEIDKLRLQATAVKLTVKAGLHKLRVVREGYIVVWHHAVHLLPQNEGAVGQFVESRQPVGRSGSGCF